ncbi:pH-response regulator protein palA/RIM20 [Nakaseomyces bracarensis]|uniref:PH-response regulator protein palA/RIM20 n=1 Tax=Nakaseomyces bracarensis TaxID=273131 RepID=A0ABR4NX95_9SACH
MTELIDIPFLLTKDCSDDLQSRLKHSIETGSLFQSYESFKEDIEEVVRTRRALIGMQFRDPILISKYYKYLEGLLKKFGSESLNFPWCYSNYYTYHGEVFMQEKLKSEQCNILCNLAITYYHQAKKVDDYKNSLPIVCDCLLKSAGCFNELLRELNKPTTESTDLNESIINALQFMMLGLAQETVWFKALGKRKELLVAKLAYKSYEYFQHSLYYFELAGQTTTYVRLIVKFVESKSYYFKAVAMYRLSQSFDNVHDNIGTMIKCLSLAVASLNYCQLESTPVFKAKCIEKLREYERDNDFIYLQTVPTNIQFNDIVEKYQLSGLKDVIQLPEISTIIDSGVDRVLFRNLLPVEIMDYGNAYNERQDAFVRQRFADPLNALNKLLNDELTAYYDIDPRHIVGNDPQSKSFVSPEELDIIELSFDDLEANAVNIETQLTNIQSYLEMEIQNDNELRSKYKEQSWNGTPSSESAKPYLAKVDALCKYLQTGRAINLDTRQLYNQIDKTIITSRATKAYLITQYNDPFLSKIEALKKRRERYISEMEKKSYQNRILSKLILYFKEHEDIPESSAGKEDLFENIYQNHIKIFDKDLKFIDDSKQENIDLVREIAEYKGHVEPGTNNEMNGAHTMYIQDVRKSLALLDEVRTNLESGTKFYQDLIDKTNALLQSTIDYLNKMKDEKGELLQTSEQMT